MTPLHEVVTNLNNRLVSDEVFSKHHEVVFVCHSLGGLVVQRLLLTFREYAQQVPFIYFFSTPETGAQIANLGGLFSSDPLLKAMFAGDENGYLQNLENEWRAAQFHIHRFCAYEKKKYRGALVVDRLSGTRNCDDPPLAINEDHMRIVKPDGVNHDSYVALQNAFKRYPIANETPTVKVSKKAMANGPAQTNVPSDGPRRKAPEKAPNSPPPPGSVQQESHVTVKGNNDVSGNNVNGNGNIVGNVTVPVCADRLGEALDPYKDVCSNIVAQLAINVANSAFSKATELENTIYDLHAHNGAEHELHARVMFTMDFRACCVQSMLDLHRELVKHRIPDAIEERGESDFTSFELHLRDQPYSNFAEIEDCAQYLKRLGTRLLARSKTTQ